MVNGTLFALDLVMLANNKENSPQSSIDKDLGDPQADKLTPGLPRSFPVSVIMESRPSNNKWVDEIWDAVGLVALEGKLEVSDDKKPKVIEQGDSKQLIYSGLKITLYLDECESYYHNLMSPEPGCFIVAREDEESIENSEVPIPCLVTLSFDEAHSYLEGDDTVYAVPIPAELYRWAEAYILDNYSAEKRRKRKRVDWKKQDDKPEGGK